MEQTYKKDNGKLRMDLLEPLWLIELSRVMTDGINKYEKDSWKLVDDKINRYYASCLRHVIAWRNGEQFDSESKIHHLSHAAVNILFLLSFELNGGRVQNEKTSKN
jgi:hypothetical protein